MMRISGVLLMMCVAVCLQGDVSSSTTTKKSIEEKTWDTDTVLGQVLDELRFLRGADQKNKEEIHSLKDADEKKTDEINHLKEMNEQFLNKINTLKDEDQKNEEEIKKNKEEIHSLKYEDKKNKEEIHSLKNADTKKTDEINILKDEDKKNKEENTKNKDEIHSLKVEDKKNKDKIDNLTELNEKNMNEINTLKGETTNSQAAAASAAFTAVMDVGTLNPDIGDVIPFNTVWLNLGQHYDDLTSVFTCAESGLYLFSVTLYSSGIRYGSAHYQMSGALMLDGFVVAEVYSWTLDPDHSQAHQSAVTAVVECPKGGSVWVECRYSGGRIYGADTTPGSVFTGFAISYNIHPDSTGKN